MEKKKVRTIGEDCGMLDGMVDHLLGMLNALSSLDRSSAAVELARGVRDIIYTKAQIIYDLKFPQEGP